MRWPEFTGGHLLLIGGMCGVLFEAPFLRGAEMSNELDLREPELDDLLADKLVRRKLGGITTMTLSRWRAQGILPPPIKINGRNYQRRSDVLRVQAADRTLGKSDGGPRNGPGRSAASD